MCHPHEIKLIIIIINNVDYYTAIISGLLILRDPGADNWGGRKIKQAKLVQAKVYLMLSKLSHTDFARFILLLTRLSAPGSPRMNFFFIRMN